MDGDLRESYRTLEERLFHEGRFITPSFIEANNMIPSFQAVGLEPLLTLNKPICIRFVVELYHSLEVKRDDKERPYIEFKLGQFTFKRKFNFTSMIIYRMEEVINKHDGPIPFAMLLTHLYNHILQTNPQTIFPTARFTFHECVIDPLDILKNPSKEKGKKIVSSSVTISSSPSSDDNEAPSFLEFYDELFDNEDLTKAQ
nr:hypothetical protein [Tanacetum cinerariifolium]